MPAGAFANFAVYGPGATSMALGDGAGVGTVELLPSALL